MKPFLFGAIVGVIIWTAERISYDVDCYRSLDGNAALLCGDLCVCSHWDGIRETKSFGIQFGGATVCGADCCH